MRAARRDLPALTRLWQACFGDTEAEGRAFWQALFDCMSWRDKSSPSLPTTSPNHFLILGSLTLSL